MFYETREAKQVVPCPEPHRFQAVQFEEPLLVSCSNSSKGETFWNAHWRITGGRAILLTIPGSFSVENKAGTVNVVTIDGQESCGIV